MENIEAEAGTAQISVMLKRSLITYCQMDQKKGKRKKNKKKNQSAFV